MDAAYSYVNAVNLAQGRGFVEDFIWNYLGQPDLPPQPSHLYWMPLTSILAGLGMLIGGVSYRAAQLPFVFLSALLAPISYEAARVLSGQRRLGWLAGILAIFSGFYFPYWTAIDNFTPFAVTGSLALLTAWYAIERVSESANQPRSVANERMANEYISPQIHNSPFTIHYSISFFLSGLLAGLAHLSRADGALLLFAIIFFNLQRIMLFNVQRSTLCASRLPPLASLLTLLGYFIVMMPWFIRNWQVVGTPLPAAGSQTIWLQNYDELFSYGRELSTQTFLAQGIGPILQGRWWALTLNLQTVLATWGMIFLTPLAFVGGWRLRRHSLAQLAGWYGLLLFGAMTLVFAFPGARGGLFHSGAALLSFIYGSALVGLDSAVEWIAARRRRWQAATAKRVFGLGLVGLAILLSCYIYYGRVLKDNGWNRADSQYPAIAAWVAQRNPAAIVMIGNPPAYRYHGGGLSVVVPNENLETTLEAAHQFKVEYLILDYNHPAPLNPVYRQPQNQPNLTLVQTFSDGADNPIYIFEIK
ncbi:MAG: hypothetical protein U0401_02785 [Anaerolineae bacterium]